MYECINGLMDGYMEFHKDPYLDHYYLNLRPLSLLISKFPQSKFNIFADNIIIYQTLPLNNNDNSSLIN